MCFCDKERPVKGCKTGTDTKECTYNGKHGMGGSLDHEFRFFLYWTSVSIDAFYSKPVLDETSAHRV